jgi:flagellar motor component MotA
MRSLFYAVCVVAVALFAARLNGIEPWIVFNGPSIVVFVALFVAASTWSFPPSQISEALRAATGSSPISNEQGARYSQIFLRLSTISISAGVTGAILGFVQMLQSMEDPSRIGPAIALGLVTTLYGVLASELLFRPWANHCLNRVGQELTL